METRKNSAKPTARFSKSAELPVDYTRVVREVYTTNFDEGLQKLAELQAVDAAGKKPASRFEVRGAIFGDEIVIAVSLVTEDQIAGTTVHASVDFDPKASSPTAQDLLNVCVDAVGSIFATLLDAEKPTTIEKIASGSLAAFDEVPLEWAKIEFDGRRVWLMVDRSNPTLDEMTDRWLAENDPQLHAEENEYEEETKDLFMTGKNTKKPSKDDDTDGDDDGDETVH